MNPSDYPQRAISRDELAWAKMKRTVGKENMKPKKAARPVPRALRAAQRQTEEHHRSMKQQAVQLWTLLGNPVFYSPANPEDGFTSEAIAIAKRGRRCAHETVRLGSNATNRAIRDHERSAKRHGNHDDEVERLREYPNALVGYARILRRAQSVNPERGSHGVGRKRRWVIIKKWHGYQIAVGK